MLELLSVSGMETFSNCSMCTTACTTSFISVESVMAHFLAMQLHKVLLIPPAPFVKATALSKLQRA